MGMLYYKGTGKAPLRTSYNRITGQSVERLAALSDGIFAVAMTLLVLDLHAPAREIVRDEAGLAHALSGMFPQLVTYLMSFLTLGIFWHGQQAQLNHFIRSNHHLSWINLAFLFGVSLMPFSTRLLADFINYRVALLCYWANIFLLGFVLYLSWRYARYAGLLKQDVTKEVCSAVARRIVIAQALYAGGAALCLINPYWSIGFIVLVQLNYAVAPRFRHHSKV